MSQTFQLENDDPPSTSTEEPTGNRSSVGINQSGVEEHGWKRMLMAIQVKVAAAKRQLRKIDMTVGADAVGRDVKEILNICDLAWDEVTIIHGDILDEEIPNGDLEVRASRIEDLIFETKDCCEKIIWQAKYKSPPIPMMTIPVDRDEGITSSTPHENREPSTGNVASANLMSDPRSSQAPVAVGCSPAAPLLQKITLDRPSRVSTTTRESPVYAAERHSIPISYPHAPRPVDFHVGVGSRFVEGYQDHHAQHQFRDGNFGTGTTLHPPGLKLELEKFDGDVIKFWDFKKRFKRHVEEVYQRYEDRIAFLESMCVGRANDAIAGLSCLVNSEEAYTRAWERLDKRFGDTSKLMNRLRQELLDGPPIKEGDSEALLKLGDKMYRCEVSFQSWNKEWMLNSQELMHCLFERLPYRIKSQFVGLSTGVSSNSTSFHDLRILVERSAAEAESEYGLLLHKMKDVRVTGTSSQSRIIPKRIFTGGRQVCATQQTVVDKPCTCCEGAHPIWRCGDFNEKSVRDRRSFVKEHSLCFNCLLPGHRVLYCRSKLSCRKCSRKHNTLLHEDRPESGPTQKENRQDGDDEKYVCAASNTTTMKSRSILKVVPVKVWINDPEKCTYTYAFIDEGSTVNMCSTAVVKRLGVPISTTSVELVTSNSTSLMTKKVDCLGIQGLDEPSSFWMKDTFVVDEVVDVSSSIPTNELVQAFPHLKELVFPELKEKRVELLLGIDLHQAFLQSEVLIGEPGEPCGLKTALGWTVYGKGDGDQEIGNELARPRLMVNFIDHKTKQEDSCEQLIKMFARDYEDEDNLPNEMPLSLEDKRALFILHNTAKKVDGHYSVGLLWKDDDSRLPESRHLAERRLLSLKRRFENNPKLFQEYSKKINEYLALYAEPIPKCAMSDRVFYIPHHCTAADTKFRVVFDCSARVNGESLNDKLLHGPDLTQGLVGVLLRFRQFPIAVVGDIKSMFSQVLVDEKDRDALRFLWFKGGDLSQSLEEYRMRTHVFGAKSSPCCAAFALRQAAIDNQTNAAEDVVETVVSDIYVDDWCKSCATEQEAIDLVEQLRSLLASGGFKLTKFVSNSKQVLRSVPAGDLAPSVDLSGDQLPLQKTLGIVWDPSSDVFRVRIGVVERPCTRRGLLSMIGQTYDPLGVIQPFLLPARQLLQQACVAKLGWDDCIGEVPGLELNWENWVKALPELSQLYLNRCILSADKKEARIELHTFTDASTVGYGACSYARIVYVDGSVQCCLLMGKSRVAPVKRVTIPRLELVAAVVGAKLVSLIRRELNLTFDSVYFWTDASVVLRYIRNSTTRFDTFVANRIETLHTLTSIEQWRYVPGNLNPADIASRGLSPSRVNSAALWFEGPPFLLKGENEWPKQPDFVDDLCDADPDVKRIGKKRCNVHLLLPEEDCLYRLFSRYSDLETLQCTVAWLLRFKWFLKWKLSKDVRPPPTDSLMVEERNEALMAIVKITQKQAFSDVLSSLPGQDAETAPENVITEERLKKYPALRKLQTLSPFVVSGYLRVGGRLRNAGLPFGTKYPLLMPNDHPVTGLLLRYHHKKEGHMGVNHVLADVNKQFWIVSGRSAARRVLDSCSVCRLWKVDKGRQQMGNLPAQRVEAVRPFNSIGTDLMGPIFVTIGRSRVKRYVCIFNCMATRAVHLEVVPSQEADAFIQAYRRFCSRRNVSPAEVFSDNGGNFVAAEKELGQTVKWHFNPPRASHQGGFYEVFFRIFRKIFRAVVADSTLSEFDLMTYVAEIERIINNRPITNIPSNPNDSAALTPSAILTGSLADNSSSREFLKADAYRHSWKKTQYLATKFWNQWTTQYLTLLQPKQKWFGAARNFKVGDLVLMLDDRMPRGQWPKAMVTEVLPDKSGLVRRVCVRTADGTLMKRDVRKLCLLEGCME